MEVNYDQNDIRNRALIAWAGTKERAEVSSAQAVIEAHDNKHYVTIALNGEIQCVFRIRSDYRGGVMLKRLFRLPVWARSEEVAI